MTWGTACQWKPRESLGEVKVGTKSQRRDRELAERGGKRQNHSPQQLAASSKAEAEPLHAIAEVRRAAIDTMASRAAPVRRPKRCFFSA